MESIKKMIPGQNSERIFDREKYILKKIENYNKSDGELKGYDCSKCNNKGNYMTLKDGYEAIKECECMKKRKMLKMINKSGLSDLLDRYTFDNFEVNELWQKDLKEKAFEFLKNHQQNWFFLGGQPGSGKTSICTAIVEKFIEQGNSARYMLWKDDIVSLKANVMDEISYSKSIKEFKQIEILYIDDFFKTEKGKKPTTADINIAFEILNYRYNNMNLITIISTELSVEDILDIDEAVGSRIYERSKKYCTMIEYDRSKNYRLK